MESEDISASTTTSDAQVRQAVPSIMFIGGLLLLAAIVTAVIM